MVFPTPFQNASNSVTSFNFSDIVSGKSYKTFFGTQTVSGGSVIDYRLFPEAIKSNQIVSDRADTTSGTFAKRIDLDFDTEFDIPQIIQGLAIANVTSGMKSADGTNDGNMKVVIEVFGGETGTTFLVSGAGVVQTMTNGAVTDNINAIEVDIPRTSFPIGHILKLNVEVWGSRTGGTGTTSFRIGLDPADRANTITGAQEPLTTSGLSTQLSFNVPFIPGDL